MEVVFWQPILSPHQSDLVGALAAMQGWDVTLVAERPLPSQYRHNGWCKPNFGTAKVIVCQDLNAVPGLMKVQSRDAAHIFSGLRRGSLSRRAFTALPAGARTVAIMTEGFDTRGWRGPVKRLLFAIDAGMLRSRVDCVLAIGDAAANWYRSAGFGSDRIAPFGYFIRPEIEIPIVCRKDAQVRLVFAGRLVRGKGVDVLLMALSALRTREWHLEIVGDGPERSKLRVLADDLGIGGRIEWAGTLPNDIVRARVASADVLVLPSRWKDGWGVVVNEAILAGVPVICTDACGAADAVRGPLVGAVCRAGSVAGMRDVLRTLLLRGKTTNARRAALAEWAKCLSATRAASYLADVLVAVRDSNTLPVAPWHVGPSVPECMG
jgi:glycosyltransferase involved in cell wall biosynthesis